MVSYFNIGYYSSNRRQAFEPGTLDPTVTFPEEPNTPIYVYGKGQIVHWKQCNVSVIEKDSSGNKDTTATYKMCDGSSPVPVGIELYLSMGKVTE